MNLLVEIVRISAKPDPLYVRRLASALGSVTGKIAGIIPTHAVSGFWKGFTEREGIEPHREAGPGGLAIGAEMPLSASGSASCLAVREERQDEPPHAGFGGQDSPAGAAGCG